MPGTPRTSPPIASLLLLLHLLLQVCVESVDDNCLLSGASSLRGAALMCGSSSSWVTLRHQAFLYHHNTFGGTVGSGTSRSVGVLGFGFRG